jgi:hypothetical protein
MRRVLLLAGVASLSWAAWAVVSGAAALLYFAAAATALLGLLLPPVLWRRRGEAPAPPERQEPEVPLETAERRHGWRDRRVRKRQLIRELEARVLRDEEEKRVLREQNALVREENEKLQARLSAESEALGNANELLAEERAARQEMVVRLDRSLERHRQERARVESQLRLAASPGLVAAVAEPPTSW